MNKKNAAFQAIIVSIITASITAILFNTSFAKITVDIWAFGVSLFLIIEAFYKIAKSNAVFWPQQFLRFIRISIGVSIFTIHVCQVIYGL